MDKPKWILVSDCLPLEGQSIVILWRYGVECVWCYELTTYRPLGKNGKPRKHPFGKTYEVRAWYPVPDLIPYDWEEYRTLHGI